MPQGFPLWHLRFWLNTFFPFFIILIPLLGIFGVITKKSDLIKYYFLFISMLIISTGICLFCIFPESMLSKIAALITLTIIVNIGIVIFIVAKLPKHKRTLLYSILCLFSSLTSGFFIAYSFRGLDPATTPSGEASIADNHLHSKIPDTARLGDNIHIIPSSGDIAFVSPIATLSISPLLTFYSKSPDRFITAFAPYDKRCLPKRSNTGISYNSQSIELEYEDDGISRLKITNPNRRKIVLSAQSELPAPIYSHLNTFSQIDIYEIEKLGISFSPCKGKIFRMSHSDYPIGRPVKLGYLDSTGTFNIVEGSSGEKGPFRKLGSGKLKKDLPLEITFHSGESPIFRLTFYDWAKQASIQLSPTAGWGLPENAISFSLVGDSDKQGVVFMTLAGTGVGRGWDSVGHTEGIYSNNVAIEYLGEKK